MKGSHQSKTLGDGEEAWPWWRSESLGGVSCSAAEVAGAWSSFDVKPGSQPVLTRTTWSNMPKVNPTEAPDNFWHFLTSSWHFLKT